MRLTPSFFAFARCAATLHVHSAKMWTWGRGLLAPDHVLGDLLTDRRPRHDLVPRLGLRSLGEGGGGETIEAARGAALASVASAATALASETLAREAKYPLHVLPRHPSVDAGPEDLRQIQASVRRPSGPPRSDPDPSRRRGQRRRGGGRFDARGAGIGGPNVRAMWPGNPSVSSSHLGAASGTGRDAAGSVSILASTV